MENNYLKESGSPGMPCPRCRKRIAVPLTELLRRNPVVCTGCGLKLELDRTASQRALAALQEFDWRLRCIGAAVRIRRALAAVGGALYRLTSIVRSGWHRNLIVLDLGSGPVISPEFPPAEPRRVVTARLGGLDCTLQLERGETEGLRRLRELLEMRS